MSCELIACGVTRAKSAHKWSDSRESSRTPVHSWAYSQWPTIPANGNNGQKYGASEPARTNEHVTTQSLSRRGNRASPPPRFDTACEDCASPLIAPPGERGPSAALSRPDRTPLLCHAVQVKLSPRARTGFFRSVPTCSASAWSGSASSADPRLRPRHSHGRCNVAGVVICLVLVLAATSVQALFPQDSPDRLTWWTNHHDRREIPPRPHPSPAARRPRRPGDAGASASATCT